MGADCRSPRGRVAVAIVAQNAAITVLGLDRGTAGGERLDLSVKGEAGPRKWRRVIPLGRDQGLEPAHALKPGSGDRDAEFGCLAFDRVEPGGVARALREEAIAPA